MLSALLLLALAAPAAVSGLARPELFPFGPTDAPDDEALPIGDDVSTSEVPLSTPIAFYGDRVDSIYINTNGLLTFDSELPRWKSDLILPLGSFRLVAPFYADVDTSLSGNVYYRETADASMLQKVETLIHANFPESSSFRPRHLLIVTWDEVGYWNSMYDQTNTFQVVIASSGRDSYALFLYPDDGINWVKGQGKYAAQAPDVPAQVGFDAGDNRRSYVLQNSGAENIAETLMKRSNINKPGMWLFQMGNTKTGELGVPGDNRIIGDQGRDPRSCSEGGSLRCDANAECQDFRSGYCCKCGAGFFGNGRNCLKPDLPQRVNGKVYGTINGVQIDEEDLHAYVVTKDGRVYTAISKVAPVIGHAMQSLYPIGGILGWLFAVQTTTKVKNGYSLTGGDLNRTAAIRFAAGGEIVEVKQELVSSDADGYMRMTTHLNGNIPNIAVGAQIVVDDAKEEYQRTAPGIVKSSATHTFYVDQVPYRFTVDQTIRFTECIWTELPDIDNQRLVISRPFVVYGESEEIVRYATTNKMAPAVGGNPCAALDLDCDIHAQCVEYGSSHRCQCNNGFYGDGLRGRCHDEDECALGSAECDPNADCYNTVGGYECACREGYSGDGRYCRRDAGSCDDFICDENAACVYDTETRQPKCECNPGYRGDGGFCEAIRDESCDVVNNCGANAECVYDDRTRGYKCRCVRGFEGDGITCRPQPCDVVNNCDRNAACEYDDRTRRYACQCNDGFTGDGYVCQQAGCDVVNNCDRNAACEYNYEERRYQCVCNEGFDGDGTYCRERAVHCNEVNNCDLNAECLFDVVTGHHQCQCKLGYEGDGYSCRLTADCSYDRGICDENAQCERRGQDHVCVCRNGFTGDGFSCQPSGGVRRAYLLMAQGMSVMELPFSPVGTERGRPAIYIPGQTAIGVDADCYARFFYWTDVSGRSIHRARLDGTDSEVVVSGLKSPEGVAVDWVGRNLYWADSGLDRIEVSRLDGTNRKTLVNAGLVNPRKIAVDPMQGYLFWCDWNRKAPKIERSNMDGSDRRVLVDTDLGLPNGLTLDYQQQRVCWVDADTHKLECCDYNGRGRRVIYEGAGWAFDVVFANNKFYWTDWDQKSLPSVDNYQQTANEPLDLPPGGNGRLYGITVVRDVCPTGTNACALNNGGCRFLCLPAPNRGRTCACPDDIDEEECNRVGLLLRR
jgi:nidogen (entactin)